MSGAAAASATDTRSDTVETAGFGARFARSGRASNCGVGAVLCSSRVYRSWDLESVLPLRGINGAGAPGRSVIGATESIRTRLAFAKRALARGDEPEEVVRKIADYRDDEKHTNHARCTVDKAQAELQPNDSAQQEESRALRDV
jgi:hypothetical protein